MEEELKAYITKKVKDKGDINIANILDITTNTVNGSCHFTISFSKESKQSHMLLYGRVNMKEFYKSLRIQKLEKINGVCIK